MPVLKPVLKPVLIALALLVPVAGFASPKIYKGAEAQAIRCAQLTFWVADEGGRLGYITEGDAWGIRAYGLYVLSRYTTGSPEQKAQALKQMNTATTSALSREKFLKSHRKCTTQFPFSVGG